MPTRNLASVTSSDSLLSRRPSSCNDEASLSNFSIRSGSTICEVEGCDVPTTTPSLYTSVNPSGRSFDSRPTLPAKTRRAPPPPARPLAIKPGTLETDPSTDPLVSTGDITNSPRPQPDSNFIPATPSVSGVHSTKVTGCNALLIALLVLSLLINVVCVGAVVAIVVGYIPVGLSSSGPRENSVNSTSGFCVPCHMVKAFSKTNIHSTQGRELCYVKVDWVTQLKEMPCKHSSSLLSSKSFHSAHVHLVAPKGDFIPDIENMLGINTNRPKSLQHIVGIGIRRNKLVITQPGFYFVYTGIRYTKDGCLDTQRDTISLQMHLYRPGTITKTTLLRSERTCCRNCTFETKTVFTGGVFPLAARDSLYVGLIGTHLVVDQNASFAGLYLVASR